MYIKQGKENKNKQTNNQSLTLKKTKVIIILSFRPRLNLIVRFTLTCSNQFAYFRDRFLFFIFYL